jgi:hypothetical protein|tara:strand:+ start:61 stop:444 length:384 start_codon:yes stop_codon:yes gene_type:complete
MTLIPRNIEQLRREGIQNAETRRQKEKDYALKVEQMSKHNVGGLYDIRAIAKSKQFKEQQSHYNTDQALSEIEDMFQSNRLYKYKDLTTDFIKKVTGRDYDSFTLRETGKFLSDLINEIKAKYEVKE